jgi:Methyltransferase domain
LIDNLLELGYSNLYLLDISLNAIEKVKARLGKLAINVTFIESDILDFNPEITFDVWHDRASFHFLTSENEIFKYKEIVSKSINSNGNFFLGTFSENGPLKCSGLEIKQYSELKLEAVFGSEFNKVKSFEEDHQTPFETIQNFIFINFKKL